MADVSGFVQGMHTATQDQQARQLTQMAMAEQPYKLQKEAIEVKQAQTNLELQQRMLRQMSTLGQNGQPSPDGAAGSMADAMDQLSRMALQSGLPEQAKQYADTASTIRKNQSTISENQSKMMLRNADITGRLMENVNDQESFDRALQMFTVVTGQPSRYTGQRYTPELADSIRRTAQSVRERAVTQRAEAQTKLDEARTRESKARVPLIEAQRRETEARDAKLRKAGDSSTIPKASQIRTITDLMNKEFDLGPEDQASARVTARPIAERMRELMAENPALRESAAARRAYQEAKNRGDFGGLDKIKDRPGASAATAQPLPADRSKLKDNKWYLVNGQPYLRMDGEYYSPDELSAEDTGETEDSLEDEDNEPAREP